MKILLRKNLTCFVMIIILLSALTLYGRNESQEKISAFGKYSGYSDAAYDGDKRVSDYLKLENGTRLAYDLFLPAKNNIPAGIPLPVLFRYTPYVRAYTMTDANGKRVVTEVAQVNWLRNMVNHGYAVIVVEQPGTGASFGVSNPTPRMSAGETDEILNWIASQSWCDGNIGMYGDSWNAMMQFFAVSTGNRHLKAIFPAGGWMDIYEAEQYRGGVYNKAFTGFFTNIIKYISTMVTPVDSDKDGLLLAEARQERSGSPGGDSLAALTIEHPFRDSTLSTGENLYEEMALYPFLERINRSGIPVYMTTGWYDLFAADMFYIYNNLTVPRRLTVRPADHTGINTNSSDLELGAEALRWFDYWLKGVRNGIMDEPPIHYYQMGVSKVEAWQTAMRWPLKKQKIVSYYLDKGMTGSIASVNDGLLTAKSPNNSKSSDAYTVDYTTTSGKKSRWVAVMQAHEYSDMGLNDMKALTYTTPPLETDIKITGHPVINLWLTTEAQDLDVFAYLEEVDSTGKSIYITEGGLRASHRKQGLAPFNNLGLPFHTHYKSDLMPIPEGKPIELAFSLLPTSYKFPKGNRIRVTITFADADNFETPIINPAPKLKLLRDKAHYSYIMLPII